MKQKIIFLDFDGVLNPTHYMNCMYKMWKASFQEIKSHFKGNYVIIDDTRDMLKEQEPFFVNTNDFVGLTMRDADKAIKILNK